MVDEGVVDGIDVGEETGVDEGTDVGIEIGSVVGTDDGAPVGRDVGSTVGADVGREVGNSWMKREVPISRLSVCDVITSRQGLARNFGRDSMMWSSCCS